MKPFSFRPLAGCTAVATGLLASGLAGAAMPDLGGVWAIVKPQTLFAPVGGGAIPFTPVGRKTYDHNRALAAKGDRGFDETMMSCASPGQPRLMLTPKPFAIYQQPAMMTIIYQWNHMFRQVQIGKQLRNPLLDHAVQAFPTAQGYPKATWEGNTLVVKNDALQQGKLLDNLLPSGEDLSTVERIRLVDQDTLEDRITITDPANFSRPWETVVTYKRQPASMLPFPEDVCLDHLHAGQPPLPR